MSNFFRNALSLYVDGFRNMTWGRTLWVVILVKLFIMFAILKVFFFPDYIASNAEEGSEADFVMEQLSDR